MGMQAAAELGIIHRDFKPSNILIDAQERARVADFGLAQSPTQLDLTQTDTTMGTPHYMAPEQAEDAHRVDTRADIYSFGATFYHALTGVPPFDGPTAFSILYKHKTEPLISPRARNGRLSATTNEFLERCLAKSPRDRFPSFGEVGRALLASPDGVSPWMPVDDEALRPYLDRFLPRRDAYLASQEAFDDRYDFPSGRVLRILSGRIELQSVDAIVSSDDDHLSMGGGVSLALLQAADPRLKEQARHFVPVRPGRAVVTTAENLPARFVFHGVTIGFSSRDFELVAPSRDLILEIMASCFYHADSLHVETLAFPLLGTGVGGFAPDVCLDTMFQHLARTFLHGLTPVKEARLVLYGSR